MARAVDVAIAVVLFRVTGPAGIVVALLYVLFADGMLSGQSPGKKVFGVKVIHLPTRAAGRYRESVLRNAPFGLVMILFMMPDLGDIAFVAGATVIGGIEAFKVVRDALGMRLGDSWAQTQVVDGKVVAGQMSLSRDGRVLLESNEPPRASRNEKAQDGG